MTAPSLVPRLAVRTVVWLGAMAVILLGTAENWRWPQAWAFVAVFGIGSLACSAWLLRRNPAVLAARVAPLVQPGQPMWDRVLVVAFVLGWGGWLALMADDAQRWHTSHVPVWLNVVGAGLIVAGLLASTGVLGANPFAAPVVRIQPGHRLADAGPYAVVRHPMYASAIPYLVGMPLLLGSWDGLLVVPLLVAGLAARAVLEERLLRRDLPGYDGYTRRVRWRLVPGVW